MSLAVLKSRALAGMEAPEVTVEVHLANGLPSFTIVGLPETEVKESKDRVRAALQNARFEFPARRITVNLAPADLPKESGRFDLPIALGILAASGQMPAAALGHYEFAGELSLSGELRPIRGALARHSAGDDRRRSARIGGGAIADQRLFLRALEGAPLSRAASYGFRRGFGGRRRIAAPRRNLAARLITWRAISREYPAPCSTASICRSRWRRCRRKRCSGKRTANRPLA